ncbi:hypothetical protein Lal_00031397 [Lupinus albus]|nr:hypothetical protein Lal_00031397 [Lupinus albus]
MDFKSKKAYIVWDVPEEDSTSSTSEVEEMTKLCLVLVMKVLKIHLRMMNVLVELHEELKKLARINVDRKRIILLHEKNIIDMQKELDELKLEHETLDLNYACASYY